MYGLEKFWAFMRYYANADELDVDPKIKTKLEPFKTIEDFKVLYPPEELTLGKRSRNSSTSSGFGGFRQIRSGNRSRRASGQTILWWKVKWGLIWRSHESKRTKKKGCECFR